MPFLARLYCVVCDVRTETPGGSPWRTSRAGKKRSWKSTKPRPPVVTIEETVIGCEAKSSRARAVLDQAKDKPDHSRCRIERRMGQAQGGPALGLRRS